MWFLQSPHLTMWAFSQVCIILFLQVLNVWAVGNHCKAGAFIWGPVFWVMHHSCYVKERHRLLPMNWRGWQHLCSAPLLHVLTAPWGLQGNVATYSPQSLINQGLGVGEWLTVHINPASVHTYLSLHPEARDSLLVFFLPVSIITTYLWKFMSHLNGKDDEVKRHGNTALIHILNIIKIHMEMHLRKHTVSVIVFPMRQLQA